MPIHLTPESNPVVQEGTLYVDSATGEFNVAGRTTPHIIPGVLYPAVGGNDIHGTDIDTSHGSTYTYGTTHTDGRKYYYTDIKGSKPIKDPRIGGHFGSQRHKFKSLQKLEQETATHGALVQSIDGRENMRVAGEHYTTSNSTVGHYVILPRTSYTDSNGHFLEVIGYFSDVNFVQQTWSDVADGSDVYIDGTLVQANRTSRTTGASPLVGRYVDAGSVFKAFDTSQTLGIHTLKYTWVNSAGTTNAYQYLFGIELIAQDTSNRNNIQIPSQNVVSYGKKFTVSAEGSSGHHYNPFNNQSIGDTTSHGKNTVGWTTYDSTLDTATSLGLGAWVDSGNYYRPVNGGRIVKWVDSSGNIKTSVNMMPPSAKAIGTHSGNSGPHETAWTSTYQPVFSSGDPDHSQAEVAKNFHWREFGNGASNTGGGGSWADASMLNSADDIAYCMDDGLTSFVADDVTTLVTPANALNLAPDDRVYITFIGTGISIYSPNWAENANAWHHIAQNLPYGTHILRIYRDSSNNSTILLDGVEVKGSTSTAPWKNPSEITFHQPKKPPIPEDACVIADYMLMADFVPQTSAGIDKISKGTRSVSCSRDFLIDDTGGNTVALDLSVGHQKGFKIGSTNVADSDTTITFRLPSFATNYVSRGYQSDTRHKLFIDTTDKDSSATKDNTASDGSYAYLTSSETLGVQKWGDNVVNGQYAVFEGFDIVTPIHTSSHYQSFETPFLHELVGGDRNMEQTNLVVSPDGKTWDEVTRDTSYIGNQTLSLSRDGGNITSGNAYVFDYVRGTTGNGRAHFNKDWVLAYDKVICLKDGQYTVDFSVFSNADAERITISVLYNADDNTLFGGKSSASSGEKTQVLNQISKHFKRGDWLKLDVGANTAYGAAADSINSASLQINKV